eukprot:symbB.v1.2.011348.t2/scaffold745.1/size165919/5
MMAFASSCLSLGKLCRTNHVDPHLQECAQLPEMAMENGKATINGRDCMKDSECPRLDGSFGECLCKQWWEGFCELTVVQPWRPAFRRFWEAAVVYCHHNWSQERCAAEIGFEEVLADMRRDAAARSSDPTEAQTLNYRGIRLQVQLDISRAAPPNSSQFGTKAPHCDPQECLQLLETRLEEIQPRFGEACAKDLGLFATAAKWLRCSSKGTALGEVIVHANS